MKKKSYFSDSQDAQTAPWEGRRRGRVRRDPQRDMIRSVSQEEVDHDENLRVRLPGRRGEEERVQEPAHQKFIKNWDRVSYQFEIAEEILMKMPATLQQYWRVKSQNMKGRVIIKHHCYCYLLFTEENERELFCEQIANLYGKENVQKQMPTPMQNIFIGLLPAKFRVEMTPKIIQLFFQENIPCVYMMEEENPFHHMKKKTDELKIEVVVTPSIHPNRKGNNQCLLAVVKDKSKISMVILEPSTNKFFVDKFKISQGNTEEKIVQRILMRYTPAEILVANDQENQIIQHLVFQMAQEIRKPFVAQINTGILDIDFFQNNFSSLYLQQLRQEYYQEKSDMEQFSRRSTVKVLKLVHKYLEGLGVVDLYFEQGFFSQRDEKRASPLSDLSASEKNFKKTVLNNCLTHQGKKLIEKYYDYPLCKRDEAEIQQCLTQILKQKSDVFLLYQQNQCFYELGKNLGVLYHLNLNKSKSGRNIQVKTLLSAPARIKKSVSLYRQEFIQVAKLLRRCQNYFKKFQELKIRLLQNKVKLVSFQQYQTTNEEQGVPLISGILDTILTKRRLNRLRQYSFRIESNHFPKNLKKLKLQELKWKEHFHSAQVEVVGDKNHLFVPENAIHFGVPSTFVKKSEKFRNNINYIAYQVPNLTLLKKELQEQKFNLYESFKKQFYQILEEFCYYRVFWFKYVEASAWIDGLFSLAIHKRRFNQPIRPGIPLQNQKRQGGSPNRPSIKAESPIQQRMQKQFPELLPTQEEVNKIMDQIEFCLNELQDNLSRFIKEQRYIFDKKQKISADMKRELKKNQEQFQQEYSQIASLMTKAKKLLSQYNLETDFDLSMPLQKGEDEHKQNKKNNPFDDGKSFPSRLHKVVYNITQHSPQLEKVEYRDILNLLQLVKKQANDFLKEDSRKTAKQAFSQLQKVLKQYLKSKEEKMIQQIFSKLNQLFISQRQLRSEWQYLIQQNDESKILHEQLEKQKDQEQSKLDQLRQLARQKQHNYNKIMGQIHAMKGNVRVFCRIRPHNPDNPYSSLKVSSKEQLFLTKNQNLEPIPFNFDRIFKQSDQQEAIFEEVEYLVQASLKGKNICIFCYGQTGTGKSHTMIGSTEGQNKGIIPRSVQCVFRLIQEKKKKGQELNVTLQIKQIHIDVMKYICEEKIVDSKEKALSVISKAILSRVTSKTEKNNTSSRSHFILTLCLKNSSNEKISSIALVDLAGSERYSFYNSKQQQEEGKSINISLLSLRDYLNKMNQATSHRPPKFEQIQEQLMLTPPPKNFSVSKLNPSKNFSVSKLKTKNPDKIHHNYPNKLTDTLIPILENNCVALIFINVSPDACDFEPTKSTLIFGKNVKNTKFSRK